MKVFQGDAPAGPLLANAEVTDRRSSAPGRLDGRSALVRSWRERQGLARAGPADGDDLLDTVRRCSSPERLEQRPPALLLLTPGSG